MNRQTNKLPLKVCILFSIGISCSDPLDANSGVEIENVTTTYTNTGTGIDTGTGTGTGTGAGIGTGIGTGTDSGADTGTGRDTGTGTDIVIPTDESTDTGKGTKTDMGHPTESTDIRTDTVAGTDTGTDTGTATGTGTGTGTGSDVNTDTIIVTTTDTNENTTHNTVEDTNTSEETVPKENEGSDCAIEDVPGPMDNSKLPDPFKKFDGTRISTKAEWRCRRQEIVKVAEAYLFGKKPKPPQSVTGTVTETKITVAVSDGGKSTSFSVSIELPSGGSGPYPAIVGLGGGFFGFPLDTFTVQDEGVALINYDPYAVGAEQGASRNNKRGAFYDIYGSDSTTGLVAAWSWGVSRIVDVIQQSDGSIIKWDAIGVSGCSRFGKGAFGIGAFDQRIALTIPFESGSAGVPIWRGIPGEGAQSPESAYGETYWLGDAFGDFTKNVNGLPLDTHEVVAMVAPRGLLILDNPHIGNLGPRSAHIAALGGAEVYKALGVGDNISYISNVEGGEHCSWRPEFTEPLKNSIQKHLTKTGNEFGVFDAHSKTTGNLSEWIDWNTPTLQ